MNDIQLITQEVENALKRSVLGNKVNSRLLEYYRKNMAEDSRYTFKIQANMLEELGVIYVKYRKRVFKCKRYFEEFNLYFTVEVSASNSD